MMVSCPGCNTSYSIDERKLPRGGGRLTCRECGKTWKIGASAEEKLAAKPPAKATPPPERASQTPPSTPAVAAPPPQFSDSSGTLQKPVNCPKCGHYFVPYQARGQSQTPRPAEPKPGPAKGRILLVEDQHYFAELTCEALGENFDTTVTATLSEARERIEASQFDLVILDLSLEEGQDGSQVLQATRRKDTPVLIFTARDETELYGGAWDQLRAAGATDILFKGINVGEELRQKVQSILSVRK